MRASCAERFSLLRWSRFNISVAVAFGSSIAGNGLVCIILLIWSRSSFRINIDQLISPAAGTAVNGHVPLAVGAHARIVFGIILKLFGLKTPSSKPMYIGRALKFADTISSYNA